jgi:hypothetical protein
MTAFAALAIVKATFVCGLALFLSYMGRRARASIRHFLFALAFVALAAIPAVMLLLPSAAIAVPVPFIARLNLLADSERAQLKVHPAGVETAQLKLRPTGVLPATGVMPDDRSDADDRSMPDTGAVPAHSARSGMAAKNGDTIAQIATTIWLTGVAIFLMPVVARSAQSRDAMEARSASHSIACLIARRTRAG